jgi:hypothetical protein
MRIEFNLYFYFLKFIHPMKKTVFILSLCAIALLLGAHDLIAQPPGMPGAPDQAPIDGGLSILALGGGAYALKRLRALKK